MQAPAEVQSESPVEQAPAAEVPQAAAAQAAEPGAVTDGSRSAAPSLRRSKAALTSGYLGLIPFTWAFYLFPYAYAGFPQWMKLRGILITTALTLLVGITPALVTAILGHRTIRRNPGCEGKGHAIFAYVSCAMAFSVLAVALILQTRR
ncbi:MAG TPA: hypothetical protein PLI95_11365 [Polyangiaceae bacterium]|nr:hypothetical protein [Polyangiaceae bacterium]